MSSLIVFRPGEYTPAAGAYVCDCADGHLWRIDVAGHIFPTFPPRCSATTWRASQSAVDEDRSEARPLA
ncbi:hypothetical protein ACFY9F_11555 [Streptomyces sp. NPDC012421]|uniref:hypothetical protein n=1 Tax=unclassified Streptomyces TaxID=2593676 RepID=UPI0036C8341E